MEFERLHHTKLDLDQGINRFKNSTLTKEEQLNQALEELNKLTSENSDLRIEIAKIQLQNKDYDAELKGYSDYQMYC